MNCLVQNEVGVLSRVSGILAARGFNIDSLVVCKTEVEDLSRMTIVLNGQDGIVEQARRQLEDLVPVWAVLDYTDSPLGVYFSPSVPWYRIVSIIAKFNIARTDVFRGTLVQRELLLAKVSLLGPEYFEELLAHHRQLTAENPASDKQLDEIAADFHPSKLPVSQALRHKHEHLDAITRLAHQFGGKVLDISNHNCIVEM